MLRIRFAPDYSMNAKTGIDFRDVRNRPRKSVQRFCNNEMR